MPIYEYRCADCQRVTEALVTPGEKGPGQCPACKSQRISRIFSVPAPHQNGEGASPCESGSCATASGLPACAGGACPHGGFDE